MRISDWSSDVCSSDLCDVYVQNDEDRDKPHRVLLLVAGAQGYLNLCRILTQAWLDNQYRGRAEVRREWLKGKDGLIVLSGGRSGDVGQALESGRLPEARALAREWSELFPGNYYIELQSAGVDGDEAYVQAAMRLAADRQSTRLNSSH